MIHCPSDPDSLDGIIIPSSKTGVVDGSALHAVEPKVPGNQNFCRIGVPFILKMLYNKNGIVLILEKGEWDG